MPRRSNSRSPATGSRDGPPAGRCRRERLDFGPGPEASDTIAAADEFQSGEPETDGVTRDAPPGSVLAGLSAAAELQRQTRHLELPVGGHFADKLRIRYRVLAQREWDKYAVLLTPDVSGKGGGDLPPMSCSTRA